MSLNRCTLLAVELTRSRQGAAGYRWDPSGEPGVKDTFTDTGTVAIPPFVWDEEDPDNFELFDLVERLNLPGQGFPFTSSEEVGFSAVLFTWGTDG